MTDDPLNGARDVIVAYFDSHGLNNAKRGARDIIDRLREAGLVLVAVEEPDAALEDRLAKHDAADMLRLLDHIADKIGLSHDQELSRDNFNAWRNRHLEIIRAFEDVCEKIAATRPRVAYLAMIDGGQGELLAELDEIRRRARAMTAAEVSPHYYHPSPMHMGDCMICGHVEDSVLHIGSAKELAARAERGEDPPGVKGRYSSQPHRL